MLAGVTDPAADQARRLRRRATRRFTATNGAACPTRNSSRCSTRSSPRCATASTTQAYDATDAAGHALRGMGGEARPARGHPDRHRRVRRPLRRHRLRHRRGHAGQGHRHLDLRLRASSPPTRRCADIPGICGIVKGAILPGYYGIEAGQSAVGDIFKWWVEVVCEGDAALHAQLTAEAAQLQARRRAACSRSTGTTATAPSWSTRCSPACSSARRCTPRRAEIYRALIEATAFGARAIIERIRNTACRSTRIVCAGGIAEKNPLLMQIYADVTGCTMQVAGSSQACALGSAVAAAVLAGGAAAGFRRPRRKR